MNEQAIRGHNRFLGIDPTKLLQVELEEIEGLLKAHYGPLFSRSAELKAAANEWIAGHTPTAATMPVIENDASNTAASDLYSMLRDHAADGGEVDEVRKKVKTQPWKACKAIDAVFGAASDPIKAAMQTINLAQASYLRKKRAEEQKRRDDEAALALMRAERLREEARKATATNETVEQAMAAREEADFAHAQARASTSDLTRSRSAMGITTSAATRYKFEVTNLRELCAAIGRGDMPVTFVIPADAAIRAAINGKSRMTAIPGIDIQEDITIRRSGA